MVYVPPDVKAREIAAAVLRRIGVINDGEVADQIVDAIYGADLTIKDD
jgi:hypothetical protein